MSAHDVQCDRSKAPEGWYCTRAIDHEGPCAAERISGYNHCSHDVSYKNPCELCDLVSAAQTVNSWGRMVDDARALIAAAGSEKLEKAYGRK